ncbi:MAG: acyclic terpene utilization AtuA family protein [Actinomycetota bacterium]
MAEPIRIANCSGFYGDRLSAAREMVEGGPIDVLTGDYLAELTMLILFRSKLKDPNRGYASTFLKQCEQILGTCLDRNIKIVVNAGGLNPSGCAEAVRELAAKLGLSAKVAHIEGDDLMPRLPDLQAAGHDLRNLDTGQTLNEAGVQPVSANAYLGGFGIAKALDLGADVVVTGRVTDAALVVGPGIWRHGWSAEDLDALAGAVVAGHIIECGAQATGGNYPFFTQIEGLEHPGFPLVELAGDGSCVVTKHEGTGGEVSVGTVTAQLLYEIAGPRYANPDVIARFDTIRLAQLAPNRVGVTSVRGEPAPPDAKVCINYLGGFRNRMELVLTGLDIDAKAALVERSIFDKLGGHEAFRSADVRLVRSDKSDAARNDQAVALLRIDVKDHDPNKVGRAFSGAVTEMALASYPGFTMTAPPGDGTPYGVYWPCLVPKSEIHEEVVFEGERSAIDQVPGQPAPEEAKRSEDRLDELAAAGKRVAELADGPTEPHPLGTFVGARSGDKGGNANCGFWVDSSERYEWMRHTLTIERIRELMGGEADDLTIERFEFPNLFALNFVFHGLLGEGVSSSSRPDPQAKGLGEYLRSRVVEIPKALL